MNNRTIFGMLCLAPAVTLIAGISVADPISGMFIITVALTALGVYFLAAAE